MVLRPGWSDRRRRMLGQALDHGRRAEQRYPAIPGKQLEDLGRIEAAARRDDLAGGFGRVRQDIAPRAVGHRRGVQNGVAGRDLVDVREVRQRHRQQIAMAQHRALRLARGAARVEQPGDVVRRHLRDRRRIAGEQGTVLGAADLDDALQTLDAVLERRDRLAQIRVTKQTRAPEWSRMYSSSRACSLAFAGTMVSPRTSRRAAARHTPARFSSRARGAPGPDRTSHAGARQHRAAPPSWP